MAGNPENVDIWSGADVFFDFTRTAPAPTDLTTPWGPLWIPAGLLNGDDGLTTTADESSEDHFAWGGILVRTTYGQHKRSVTVAMLEDNAVTFELVNPGESTRTVADGVITSEIFVPERRKLRMGLQLKDGLKIKRRIIPTVELGELPEIQEAENTMTQYNVGLNIYPDGTKKLWTDLKTDPNYVPPGGD